MSLAYYKRFPRDFLEGTIGLSFEEKGAYSIILDLIYARDGQLPDDSRFIAGNLNCSLRKWKSIRDSLVAKGKLHVENGIISNFRADNLLETSRRFQDKQAENAATPRKNNDLQKPPQSHSRDYPEPEPERKNPPTPRGGFDVFYAAYPKKVDRRTAQKAFERAIKRINGADDPLGMILAGVERAKVSDQWRRGFVKNPATWLNADGWLDEAPAAPQRIGFI